MVPGDFVSATLRYTSLLIAIKGVHLQTMFHYLYALMP